MKTVWTQHLQDQKDKDRFENTILGSKETLNRLREILADKYEAQDRDLSSEAFDCPNWAYKQAYQNGIRFCIKEIDDLINLNQGKQ